LYRTSGGHASLCPKDPSESLFSCHSHRTFIESIYLLQLMIYIRQCDHKGAFMTGAIPNIEADLAHYPNVYVYLQAETPDVSVLQEADYQKAYYNLPSHGEELSLFDLCCIYGKKTHIEALGLSREERIKAVNANQYRVLQLAAKNGHTQIIKYLLSHLNDKEQNEAVKANGYVAIQPPSPTCSIKKPVLPMLNLMTSNTVNSMCILLSRNN